MAEIPKAERILRLIRLLRERKRTVLQLAGLLGTIPRNVYRDLKDVENIGYQLYCDSEARYSLETEPTASRTVFTLEETSLLRQHLAALSPAHPLKASIERKLYLSSELLPLADELADKHRATLISRLNRAIGEGRQIRLIKYNSSNSSSIADRTVEPISLTDDFSTLNAYELATQKQKTYKIARMEDVEILKTAKVHHEESVELDLFGFSGHIELPVLIRLSFMAYRLLFEEFPVSRAYLILKDRGTSYPYEFRYMVRDFRGIGRFILGLAGEVEVLESEELRAFLREKTGRIGW